MSLRTHQQHGLTTLQIHQHNDFTLHLVVRQPETRPQSRTTTPPLQPHHAPLPPPQPALHQPNQPPHLPQLPPHFRQPNMPQLPGYVMGQMPGMPHTPHYLHNHLHHHHHLNQPNIAPPTPLHNPVTPNPQGLPTPNREATPQPAPFGPPNPARMMPTPSPNLIQNLLHRHQQERAALGQHGVPHPPQNPPNQSEPNTDPADPSRPQSAAAGQPAPAAAPNMAAPNGTRYTVTTVNRSTFALPPMGQQLPFQQNAFAFAPPHFPQQPNYLNPAQNAFITNTTRQNPLPNDVAEAFDDVITAQEVRDLAELTATFAATMQERAGATETERHSANVLRITSEAVAERIRNSNIARTNAASSQPPQPSAAARNQHPTPVSNIPTNASSLHPATQDASVQGQPFDATAPTVYLLSSPTGPQGLLFTPQGNYTTTLPHTQFLNSRYTTLAGLAPRSVRRFNPTPTQALAGGQPPQNVVPGHDQHQAAVAELHQQANQVEQQILQAMGGAQQQNQPVDLLQQWQPLLAQAWLLLRIMLFTWILLGTGQGWRRPLILMFIGLAFWLLNGGMIGRGAREAVQAWWEGVVGVPRQNAPGDAQAQPQPTGGAQQQPPAPGAAAGQPAPQNQQNQDQQQHGWLRQTLRPAERALALFIASLWPGVGERTVAARREEENRLRRLADENRAREETLRLQNEEQASASETAEQNASGTETLIPDEETSASAITSGVETVGGSGSKSGEEVRERRPVTATEDAIAGPSQPVNAQSESAKDE